MYMGIMSDAWQFESGKKKLDRKQYPVLLRVAQSSTRLVAGIDCELTRFTDPLI